MFLKWLFGKNTQNEIPDKAVVFVEKQQGFGTYGRCPPKIEVLSTCDLHPFSCIHNYALFMTEAICRCRLLYWIVVGFRHLFISPQVDHSMSELETVI